MMITMESIIEKLGFDPLTYEYVDPNIDYEDDSIPNPLEKLSAEELDFVMKAALNDPECWKKATA